MNIETSTSTRPAAVISVWLAIAYTWLADSSRAFGRRLADDAGVEDSPSKLIFLAVAVAIAIADAALTPNPCSKKYKTGTMTIPPPTPSNPARTPAKTPVAINAATMGHALNSSVITLSLL